MKAYRNAYFQLVMTIKVYFQMKIIYATLKIFLLKLLLLIPFQLVGQLSNRHWIPPMPAVQDYGCQSQYFYISTPSSLPFKVYVKDGKGETLMNFDISDATPFIIEIPPFRDTRDLELRNLFRKIILQVSAQNRETNTVYNDRGLIFEGAKEFYVNYRIKEENHAGSITSKGKSSLGNKFRIGHFESSPSVSKYNFFSVMSTENNTEVVFSEFTDGIVPIGSQSVLNSEFTFVLPEAGNTYSMAFNTWGDPDKILGSLLESNHPIVVTCGSWGSSPVGARLLDIGIDQIVPLKLVGKEYIVVKGNGPDELETPIVIAHFDNTEIYVNDQILPIATLNRGDHHVLSSTYYTSRQNMYIRSSKDIYLYQSLAGSELPQTGGLNFIPPIGCSMNSSVNNIPQINKIGDAEFKGGVFIITNKGGDIKINGGSIVAGLPSEVLGREDYVTYKILGLSGNIAVESEGPVQVGLFGNFENAGWAGYYSGFATGEEPHIELTKKRGCSDTLVATFNFPGVLSWYKNNIVIDSFSDPILIAHEDGDYKVMLSIDDSCLENNLDITSNTFKVVKSSWTDSVKLKVTEPYCDLANGALEVETIMNAGPLTYLLDPGLIQSTSSFQNLPPGQYSLTVKDTNFCQVSLNVSIEENSISPVIDVETIPSLCGLKNGSVMISTRGLMGSVEYSIDGFRYQSPNKFSELAGGEYEIFVKDENNCIISNIVEVERSNLLVLKDIVTVLPNCGKKNGGVKLVFEGGNGEIQVLLNNILSSTHSFQGLGSDLYSLNAKDDTGCTIDTVFALTPGDCPFYIPNTFSPNEDGVNDNFKVFPHMDFKGNFLKLKIFDRWGSLIFSANNFDPNIASWDGRKAGKVMNAGVYSYLLEVKTEGEAIRIYKGEINLIR